MRMTRREARILAMQVLYTYDLNKINIDDALKTVQEQSNEEVEKFVMNCYNNLDKIDVLIATSLENYSIDRLNLVDKAIIRLAVSEMLQGEVRGVIINEALEITKIFTDQGDHKATSFNNSLLDKINKKLK